MRDFLFKIFLLVCLSALWQCSTMVTEPYDGQRFAPVKPGKIKVLHYTSKQPINTRQLLANGYQHMGGLLIKTNGSIKSAIRRGSKQAAANGAHLMIVNHRDFMHGASSKLKYSAKGAFPGEIQDKVGKKDLREVYFVFYRCSQERCPEK